MKFPYSSAIVFGLVLFLATGSQVSAQKRKARVIKRGNIATVTAIKARAPMPPEALRRHLTFMQVWQTINDHYFDATFSNLDWNKIRVEYEPKAKAARTDLELHNILNAMIGRLERSHLSIIPPEVYDAIEKARAEVKAKEKNRDLEPSSGHEEAEGEKGEEEELLDDPSMRFGIGVELSLLSDRFVITRMDKDSAAEYFGLRRGYVIEKVNDVSLSEMLGRVQIYYSGVRNSSIKQFVPAAVVAGMLNGGRDTYVDITYLDENDRSREIRVRREPLKERAIVIAPNFPQQQISFESRSVGESIGYIRFNVFAVPVIEKFCNAVAEHKSKEALIIDMRGNSGGVMVTLPLLAGMLTNEALEIGTSIYRSRSEPLRAPSRANNFKGRVILLVDERTASAAEIFALGLRENGRALLVGERTAGEALPSVAVKLPTGAVLLYPFANYRSAGGKFIEGSGVDPDVKVTTDRKALLQGNDPQFDAAVKLVSDKTAFIALTRLEKPAENAGNGPVQAQPPPPPPKKAPPPTKMENEQKLTMLGSPVVSKREFKPGHDDQAKKYVADFLLAIGGKEALKALKKYALTGTATVGSYGDTTQFTFRAYREKPDRYAEHLYSDSTGEIREIYDGKKHTVQTDFGWDADLPLILGVNEADVLGPLFDVVAADEAFPSLSFTGTFDKEGRKTAVLEGKSRNGAEISLAFDVETKLLVSFTGGIRWTHFGDYRKVGEVMLPFNISREDVLNVQLDTVFVNVPLAVENFSKKDKCFDTVN